MCVCVCVCTYIVGYLCCNFHNQYCLMRYFLGAIGFEHHTGKYMFIDFCIVSLFHITQVLRCIFMHTVFMLPLNVRAGTIFIIKRLYTCS